MWGYVGFFYPSTHIKIQWYYHYFSATVCAVLRCSGILNNVLSPHNAVFSSDSK